MFRQILQKRFIWQINNQFPDLIRLDLDTVILENVPSSNRRPEIHEVDIEE